MPDQPTSQQPTGDIGVDAMTVLFDLIEWMDHDLDSHVAEAYKEQPLAQDWARVAKVQEEAGEAVDALIGITGQNPRKGKYGSALDLYDELCDTALTALYALQHFTKQRDVTRQVLMNRALHHRARREAQMETQTGGAD